MITDNEAQQALKTIAEYCDMRNCYDCKIKFVCERLEMKKLPFYIISDAMKKIVRKGRSKHDDR